MLFFALLVAFVVLLAKDGKIWKAATSSLFSDDDESKSEFEKIARPILAGFFMGLLPVLIMAPEFLIRWNHIGGVGTIRSTGQLIPFVVAVAGLVNILYKILVDKCT